ncbi:MAG: hypothetical protein GWM87_09710 [Xanthomonadales bacterium]|nr:hypothetical protein [Xanthomonadales bacterium]NIX13175.1 hypothetical protein [Xanthomonadales bacterium]
MNPNTRKILMWSPRILGILLALFLGVFALDAFGEGTSLASALIEFLIHLVPTYLLLIIVAIAWRRPWFGGAAFIFLALLYAATTIGRWHWILNISGPLVLVGVLYVVDWWLGRRQAP